MTGYLPLADAVPVATDVNYVLLMVSVFGNGEIGMLVLTRNTDESIVIGDDITVTVLAVSGNQVRIGIDAPKDVEVHREEIYQQIQAESRADDR